MQLIQSRTSHTLVWLLCAGLLLPLLVFADGFDDFDDNSKNTTKWGEEVKLALGVLTETNQRLEFTCNNVVSDGDTFWPWKLERFPVNGNWTNQVDVFNATAPSMFGQVTSVGFTLLHPTNADSEIYVELYAAATGSPTTLGFDANLETDDVNVGTADTGSLGPFLGVYGAVRMEYSSATKVVTCYYDVDRNDGYQWTELASFGLAGSGGTTANTDWGLASNQQFSVWVYGYSANMTVSSGKLYLNDFIETGGVPPSGEPSPIPTGNWQFGFPTNNPLLTVIASITGNYTGFTDTPHHRVYNINVAQDESGKVVAMGTMDGITNDQGGSEVGGMTGKVGTEDGKPAASVTGTFAGARDGTPISAKGSASGPLELTDGGGTNFLNGTCSGSAKVAGVPMSMPAAPFQLPATPDMEANLSKNWILDLNISQKTVNGKLVTVSTALLKLPNGDMISFPEKKVKYSTTKGYKLSFKKGTNTTVNPNRLDKKTSIKIQGLIFVKAGEDWQPTAGAITYQFLGQKGTANLLDFTGP